MEVDYSKDFRDSVQKLSGKMKDSVRDTIKAVKEAESLQKIHGLKKLVSFKYVYRLRIGGYRAFFVYHVQILDDTVIFQYLLPRGEAYGKKSLKRLKNKDI